MEQIDDGSGGQPVSRRLRRSQEQWHALIEAQPSSGLGVEEYCRQLQVTTSCFYRWRRALTVTSGATPPRVAKHRRLPALQGFAAVQVLQDQEGPGLLPPEPLRLALAGGRELILPVSMPIQRLVELLVALECGPSSLKARSSSLERGA